MPSLPIQIVFFGTAELACPSLSALAQSGNYRIAGVVTQPDRPKGRDLQLQPPPVKVEALRLSLPVYQPLKARDTSFIQTLRELGPDLIVVAAYGQILPQSILDLPRFGCLNVHTSILPKYRGAAPIQWAIADGEPETGVTIMKMDAGLDTGDMVALEKTPISSDDNAQTLHDRLAQIGAQLLLKTIPEYISGSIKPEKQPDHGATYARKISKDDGKVDWNLPAKVIWNRTRAFTPWPGAFTFLSPGQNQKLLKIWQLAVEDRSGNPGEILEAGPDGIVVACGEHAIRIQLLQKEGGKRLTAQAFLAGNPLKKGERLG